MLFHFYALSKSNRLSLPVIGAHAFRAFSGALLLLCFSVLSACGESGNSSSAISSAAAGASAPSAAESQTAAVPKSSKSASSAASAASRAASSAASAQSDGGYVLPAGSSAPAGSAAQNAESAASSGSVFHSLFGDSSASSAPAAERDKSGSRVSLAEYDSLADGMSYDAVKAAIGGSGKLMWEFGEKAGSLYTVCYRWEGAGISGAYAECTFADGKLSSKIQFGLN